MKKDIMIIRQAIERVVSLLARRSINVTQRGSRAFVEYTPGGAIKRVNVPYMPDTASDEFVAAVQGFLDHEVGHVLHSDVAVLNKAMKMGARVKNLANIVEDVFIEGKMQGEFAGCGVNLENVRKFYLNTIVAPKVKEALAAGDAKGAVGYLTVVAFRAWGGQTACEDYLNATGGWALLKDVKESIGEDLIAQIPRCKNSGDCLHLADRIVKRMHEWEEKKREEERAKKAAEPSGGKGREPSGAGTPGTKRAETDTSGKKREKPKAAETLPPEGDPTAETDPELEEPATPPEASTPEEKPEEKPSEPEAPAADPTAEADEPKAADDSDADDADDAGGDDDFDEEDREAPGDHEGDADDEEDDEAETGPAPTGEEATAAADPAEPEPPAKDRVADIFDTDRDFDDAMGEALSTKGREELAASPYRIFSTEWDEIEMAPECANPKKVAELHEAVLQMVGVMSKQLERAIAAQSKVAWQPGLKRGRVNPSSLFRSAVGDDRLFRRKQEHKSRSTAMTLLVDCSGSMFGSKIRTAGYAAYALSMVLERIGIKHEVIGFTTRKNPAFTAAMTKEARHERYSRNQSLYMPIFKGFDERLTAQAKARMATLIDDPMWLKENVDGECVQIAAHRLKMRRAERHILMVLSDGYPACPPGYKLHEHLMTVVKKASAEMDLIGVGIQSRAVSDFYPKHVVLDDINELPTRVVAELSRLLLGQGPVKTAVDDKSGLTV